MIIGVSNSGKFLILDAVLSSQESRTLACLFLTAESYVANCHNRSSYLIASK